MVKRNRIVWCAGVPWGSVRGTDQNLAAALGGHFDITYVEPPISVLRRRTLDPDGVDPSGPEAGVRLRRVSAIPGARVSAVRLINASLHRARVRLPCRQRPRSQLS